MMNGFFGEPTSQYSHDQGKTWRTDGPFIGPGVRMRVITQDGKVIFSAHAQEYEKTCDCYDGTGKRTIYRFEQDAGGSR
jgi:hypothetical protein